MKEVDTGKDKIQKICDLLKKETLDPAKQQANEIIENAKLQKEEIIKQAHKDAQNIIEEAKKNIEHERRIFDSALNLAAKQGFEDLKQKIENQLFNKNLQEIINKEASDPQIISKLLIVIIDAIEEEGMDVDLSAYIPKKVDSKAINAFLSKEILEKLREKEVVLDNFHAGVKVKLHDLQITIDMSDEAIKELIAGYIRKDFRERIFKI